MIEAMLVLPILFSTVFFIVWYSRTMHESNMMNEAMYRAGKMASTVPNLDIDLADAGEPQDVNALGVRPELKEFRRAVKANEFIKNAGVDFLKSVGFLKVSGSEEVLELTKQFKRPNPSGGDYTSTQTGEMFALLPGECVTYTSNAGGTAHDAVSCNNKVLNLGFTDGVEMSDADKAKLQAPKVLLKQYPIKIVSIANVSSSMFHGGGGEKEFNFYVIREPIPAGPFSSSVDEGELGNGAVAGGTGDQGVLGFGVPGDEGGVGAVCARPAGYLVWFDRMHCSWGGAIYKTPFILEPMTGNCEPKCK